MSTSASELIKRWEQGIKEPPKIQRKGTLTKSSSSHDFKDIIKKFDTHLQQNIAQVNKRRSYSPPPVSHRQEEQEVIIPIPRIKPVSSNPQKESPKQKLGQWDDIIMNWSEQFQNIVQAIICHIVLHYDNHPKPDPWVRGSVDVEQQSVTYKYYSPQIYASIRKQILGKNYKNSLIPDVCKSRLKLKMTPGKSGSLLAFSEDPTRQYVLKTMEHHESLLLQSIESDYFNHLTKNPNSLISKFFLHFKFQFRDQHVYMVVMNNVFQPLFKIDKDICIHTVYDLKGSTIGREANEDEAYAGELKDLDLMKSGRKFKVGRTWKGFLLAQLRVDIQFLTNHGIMDYSLLLGVTSYVKYRSLKLSKDLTLSCIVSEDQTELYCCGVIDILQGWNLKKKAAMVYKSINNVRSELSTVPPEEFGDRFDKFVDQIFE